MAPNTPPGSPENPRKRANPSSSARPSGKMDDGMEPVHKKSKKYGDSGKVAAARLRVGGGIRGKQIAASFGKWKKGREAQHLIPAAVCDDFGIPMDLANSGINGMMLPSGRVYAPPKHDKSTHHKRIVALDKNKVRHIEAYSSNHNKYNDHVKKYLEDSGWVRGQVTEQMFIEEANYLRGLHKHYRRVDAVNQIRPRRNDRVRRKANLRYKKYSDQPWKYM